MKYTSIEQSKKLLELGVDPNSADLCFIGKGEIIDPINDKYNIDLHPYSEVYTKLHQMRTSNQIDKDMFGLDDGTLNSILDQLKRIVPSWSIDALINLLPRKINKTSLNIFPYDFNGNKQISNWVARYAKYDIENEVFEFRIESESKTLFDAIFNLCLKILDKNGTK